MNRTNDAAFEAVIEVHRLNSGYTPLAGEYRGVTR